MGQWVGGNAPGKAGGRITQPVGHVSVHDIPDHERDDQDDNKEDITCRIHNGSYSSVVALVMKVPNGCIIKQSKEKCSFDYALLVQALSIFRPPREK